MILKLLAIIIVGYLLGSIPFGVIIGKLTTGKDIREHGSGKMGSTNVLRVAGKKAAILVASLDILKGALAALFAGWIAHSTSYLILGDVGLSQIAAQAIAALAAIAGHNWPIFLKFKGGRGVATYFGGLFALCPIAALFGGAILFVCTGFTRYSSLGSIAGVVGAYAILVPLTIISGFHLEFLLYSLIGSIIILFMHRDNISRLLNGSERRIGERV